MKLVYELVEDVGLEDLLRDDVVRAELNGAMAIISTPDRCIVGRIEAGVCRGPSGAAQPIAGVFEARAFTARRELRWRLTPGGGRALLLSEEHGAGLAEPTEVEMERLGEQCYLLNGQRDGEAMSGWTILSASHVASIVVPFATDAERLELVAVEYVRRDPEHGNAYVSEERLTGLRPAAGPVQA